MARKPKTFAEASPDELGVDSEGQAAQMEATDQIGAYGPDAWPVNWNGIILGALGTLAALLVVGLSGVALGAHHAAGPDRVILDWHRVGWGTVFFSIFGTFLSFALGGWIAGQIAGFRRAEPCMLHGACAWLAAIPVLAFLAGMGTAGMYGGWLSGLAPNHPGWAYVAVETPPAQPIGTAAYTDAAQSPRIVTNEQVARAARNTALATVAALLLGLMGGVIGGWMASGEPMTFTYYRTRDLALRTQ